MNASFDRFVQEIQIEYYNRDCPHKGVTKVTPGTDSQNSLVIQTIGQVVCDVSLGELLKSYR